MAAGGHQSQSKNGATSNTKSVNGIDMDDDGDNRTRNAKAQRRHREKRKAHLKLLEESVGLLTAQLEDARSQIGRGGYANRMPQGPMSPNGKSMADLQAENAYLRDENAELRRQVYMYTGEYGLRREEVKQEGFAQQYVPQPQPLTSPREGSSRDGQHPPPKPMPYPPPTADGDHFSRGSRSRVSSSSTTQAPGASPYLTSNTSFPTDPRAHALNQPPQPMDRYPPLRYESHGHMYTSPANHSHPHPHSHSHNHNPATHSPTGPPQPPPHSLPRSGMSYGVDMYGHRPDGEPSWGPEAGPPPFQGSVYPVTYGDGPAQDEWRHDEHH